MYSQFKTEVLEDLVMEMKKAGKTSWQIQEALRDFHQIELIRESPHKQKSFFQKFEDANPKFLERLLSLGKLFLDDWPRPKIYLLNLSGIPLSLFSITDK